MNEFEGSSVILIGAGRELDTLLRSGSRKMEQASWRSPGIRLLPRGLSVMAPTTPVLVEHQADVTSPGDGEEYVHPALTEFGRIDGLFSNAWHRRPYKAIPDLSDEEWRRAIGVNLDGVVAWPQAHDPGPVDQRDRARLDQLLRALVPVRVAPVSLSRQPVPDAISHAETLTTLPPPSGSLYATRGRCPSCRGTSPPGAL